MQHLLGFGAQISETSRFTDQKLELDEEEREIIDLKIQTISSLINSHKASNKTSDKNSNEIPTFEITYFEKDELKDGGMYLTTKVPIKKIDDYNEALILENGCTISIENIVSIDSEYFENINFI